jgi:hypothetical protein
MARPRYEGGGYKAVYFPRWRYLSGETLTMDGTAQACTLPTGAHIFEIRAEGAAVYFNINRAVADATAHGYVADGSGEIVGPLANLSSLTLYGAAADAAVAHVMYFREE